MTTPDLGRLALGVLVGAFAGTSLPDDYRELLADGLGGVCLFGSNTGSSTLVELTTAIRAASPTAVIAIDEEGGDVTRLHATALSPVPGAAVLGALDDLALTHDVGRAVGAELRAVGVTLDLGPVADVNTNPDNPVIGTRSFGSDPDLVARHVAAWTSGLQEAGVAACVKHFPGHGDTAVDSHLALPTVHADRETLATRELVPFAAAVAAGAASVMTSHLVVPSLDPGVPATFSRPVLDLLRDRIGFTGVVVSDALDMAGASADRGIPEAAVLALAAGVDLLCLGSDHPAASVREVQSAIVSAVQEGRLPLARLEDAVTRVAGMRAELVMPAPYEINVQRLDDAVRRAMVVEGELPDLTGARVLSVDTQANIAVGDVPWGIAPDEVVDPSTAHLPDGAFIVQVRDAHRRPEVIQLLRRVEESKVRAVVIEWGWPGAYAAGLPRICTLGVSGPGVRAVEALLREKGWTP